MCKQRPLLECKAHSGVPLFSPEPVISASLTQAVRDVLSGANSEESVLKTIVATATYSASFATLLLSPARGATEGATRSTYRRAGQGFLSPGTDKQHESNTPLRRDSGTAARSQRRHDFKVVQPRTPRQTVSTPASQEHHVWILLRYPLHAYGRHAST